MCIHHDLSLCLPLCILCYNLNIHVQEGKYWSPDQELCLGGAQSRKSQRSLDRLRDAGGVLAELSRGNSNFQNSHFLHLAHPWLQGSLSSPSLAEVTSTHTRRQRQKYSVLSTGGVRMLSLCCAGSAVELCNGLWPTGDGRHRDVPEAQPRDRESWWHHTAELVHM